MAETLNNAVDAVEETQIAVSEVAPAPVDNAAVGATMVTADKSILDTQYTPGENHPSIPSEPPANFTAKYAEVYHKQDVVAALDKLNAASPEAGATPEQSAEPSKQSTAEAGSSYDDIVFPPTLAEEEAIAVKSEQDAKAEMEYLGPVTPEAPLVEVDQDIMKTKLANPLTDEDTGSIQQEQTNFAAMAAEGDSQQLAIDEMQKYAQGEDSLLTKSFKAIDALFSPLAATGAAIMAPLANPANTGSFLGDVWANLGISGDAFNERASRLTKPLIDGGVMPEFGNQIVDRHMSNIPDKYKGMAATAVELLLDPTIFISGGLAIGMKRSIAATQFMNKSSNFQGLITDGVYKAFGWLPDKTIASVVDKELVELAKQADAGSREALVELSQKMAGKKASVMGTENMTNMVNSIMKADPNAASYTVAKTAARDGDVPEELLIQNIKELETKNRMQFNLHAINNEDDFAKTFDSAVEDYKAIYNDFIDESGMSQLEAAKSVNESLSHFMGKDIHHFSPEEASAFIAIGDSSARQLVEFAQIMGSSVVSPAAKDVARVAFAKQLKVHEAIQDRINQVGSSMGSGLQVFDMRKC